VLLILDRWGTIVGAYYDRNTYLEKAFTLGYSPGQEVAEANLTWFLNGKRRHEGVRTIRKMVNLCDVPKPNYSCDEKMAVRP
jgi:hypothetical protein